MTVSAMAPPEATPTLDVRPDVEHLVTEDDTPVDNLFSEKQKRLLTAENAEQRAEKLAEQLRRLGATPNA